MKKIDLSICRDDLNSQRVLGIKYILDSLIKSERFNIAYHNESIEVFRGQMATLLQVNDKKVYLDFWEYATPTHTNEIFNKNLDLIIKLQHKNMTPEHYLWFCKRKNIMSNLTDEQKTDFLKKIVPFTFFSSRMFEHYINKENEIEKLQDENVGFFCGKEWHCRSKMIDKFKKECIEYLKSDQGEVGGRPLTDEEFLRKMKTSKYGIVLAGRSTAITDAKNRREIDYMMLGKPLLLNYKPFYYNPLVEGKHYIYIDANTDFKNLDKMYNMEEIVSNATDWYNKNASPKGVADTLIQILTERGIV